MQTSVETETSQIVFEWPGLVYEKLNGSGVEKHLTHLGRAAILTYAKSKATNEAALHDFESCVQCVPSMWRFVVTANLPTFDDLLPHLEQSTQNLCGSKHISFSTSLSVVLIATDGGQPLFVVQQSRSGAGKSSINVHCANDQSLAQLIGALHLLNREVTLSITKQTEDGLEPLGSINCADRSVCRVFLEEFEPRISDPDFCRLIGLLVLCRVQDIPITGRKALLDF